MCACAQVAARGAHVLALDATGRCWAWGRGDEGQLGIGKVTDAQARPRPVEAFEVPPSVDHRRWRPSSPPKRGGGGCDGLGPPPPAPPELQSPPRTSSALSSSSDGGGGGGSGVGPLPFRPVLVAVAAGRQHSCALDDQGRLWTWGGGDDGALGHGDHKRQLVPKVEGLRSGWTSSRRTRTH